MAKYTTSLLNKEAVADRTIKFIFKKPEGFQYESGQSVDLTLINPSRTDEEGNMRSFSLVSAPYEEDLMIATRIRESAFKQTINSLPLGSNISLEGPLGSFILHHTAETPAVFLTGGIGITPFISMMKTVGYEGRVTDIYLFYANKKQTDIPFLAEIKHLMEENPHLHVVFTLTEDKPTNWEGELGRIDLPMLSKYVSDLTKPIYYTAGPLAMVNAMRELLNSAHVNPDYIRFEDFPRY